MATKSDFLSLIVPDSVHHVMKDVSENKFFAEGRVCSSTEDCARTLNQSDGSFACKNTADMLSVCSFASGSLLEYQDAMDLDKPMPAVHQSMYDPMRPLRCFAPPKRFFGSFWISMARRLLQKDKTITNY